MSMRGPWLNRRDWIMRGPGSTTYRIMRWSDHLPGKPFQESLSLGARGAIEALRFDRENEAVALAIYADLGDDGTARAWPLDEKAWDAIRRAFETGRYVLVPDRGRAHDITFEQLKGIMPKVPKAKAWDYVPLLNDAMDDADITTPLRQAAFLAQLAVESHELNHFVEDQSGDEYEGRVDIGNTQPGDGRRFKGRGPIQITGRTNYTALGQTLHIDLVNHPELVATPEVGFRAAAWYWNTRPVSLNALADARDFNEITRRVNGGENEKAERDKYYVTAKRVLECL